MPFHMPARLLLFLAFVGGAGLAVLAPWSLAAEEESRPAPELTAPTWLNSKPLSLAELRGKVVLVEFWTFACWNCQNIERHVKRWHERYEKAGLRIVAVHTPEFDRERSVENVRKYLRKKGLTYPVAIDNDFEIWKRYNNRYWPTLYLIDRAGDIRYVRIGEGGHDETEAKLEQLLSESS